MNDNVEKIEISVNDKKIAVPKGATISQLLDQLKINTRAVAVELNEEIQPKGQHAKKVLNQGDWLEIVTLVGGG